MRRRYRVKWSSTWHRLEIREVEDHGSRRAHDLMTTRSFQHGGVFSEPTLKYISDLLRATLLNINHLHIQS